MTPTATGTELQEIQRWYAEQCDGDWEHSYGVQIGTLDNPGWSVDIDLADTDLEIRPFEEASDMVPEDWWMCKVRDAQFQGRGSPAMLGALLRVFLNWAYAPSN
jgi:hypothetical protein